jgi:hypothetical protein
MPNPDIAERTDALRRMAPRFVAESLPASEGHAPGEIDTAR